MAKCRRCGKSLFLKKKLQLKDAEVCESCGKELNLEIYIPLNFYTYDAVKDGYEAYLQRKGQTNTQTASGAKPTASNAKNEYFFLVHDLDEEFIEKYRKQNTDKEDLWEGMSYNDIREECVEDDRIYKYPEMDLYLEFKESTLDGNPSLEVYLDDHMVGYVPKTKVGKAKELLADDNVSWKAELYGGDYQYLKGTYVDEWFDKVNIRVTFTW